MSITVKKKEESAIIQTMRWPPPLITMPSKKWAVRRGLNLCRTRYNRLKIAETVLWIVFRLERAQFVQAPWFITINGLKRLVVFTLSVIYIRLWLTMGLAGVPKSPVLLCPRLCRVRQARPFQNFAEEDTIDTN